MTSLDSLCLLRTQLFARQPRCNLAAPQVEKDAYEQRVETWLKAMVVIDVLIALERKRDAV